MKVISSRDPSADSHRRSPASSSFCRREVRRGRHVSPRRRASQGLRSPEQRQPSLCSRLVSPDSCLPRRVDRWRRHRPRRPVGVAIAACPPLLVALLTAAAQPRVVVSPSDRLLTTRRAHPLCCCRDHAGTASPRQVRHWVRRTGIGCSQIEQRATRASAPFSLRHTPHSPSGVRKHRRSHTLQVGRVYDAACRHSPHRPSARGIHLAPHFAHSAYTRGIASSSLCAESPSLPTGPVPAVAS